MIGTFTDFFRSPIVKGTAAIQPMQQALPPLEIQPGSPAMRLNRLDPGDLRRRLALFLDIDGTLLDLAATPQAVVVPDMLPGVLSALESRLDGAVALVTGRSLADVDRLFPNLRFTVGAQHGGEMRGPARQPRQEMTFVAALNRLRPRLETILPSWEGLLLEDKGRSLAIHYRKNPSVAYELKTIINRILAPEADALELLEGKCVFEIKPKSFNKGDVVRALMTVAPFKGRVPIFIGDDETDRAGMSAARAHGGCAIRVGDKRDLLADGFLPSPAATRAWLRELSIRLDRDAGMAQ
jgi:trehalose 6-phosphate phosphatase